jgi:outer membrane protein TolC
MAPVLHAQQPMPLDLQQAIDLALQHNRALHIKKLQQSEKEAKLHEDAIKQYPAVTVSSAYQYNQNLGALNIPAGYFGALPLGGTTIELPNKDASFELGKHNNFNAGVTVYQPITQLGKIKAGMEVTKTDVLIAEQESRKAALQIRQAVEKLYYGLLINQQQQVTANANLQLAQMKQFDVESALMAGKTVDASKAGLQANVADEEQNLLKLQIQADDYMADLQQLTGITADSVILAKVDYSPQPISDSISGDNNVDIRLATLTRVKTEQAIKAAQRSYLPDFGLMAGYTYQTGNVLYPSSNPFVGASFKWNIQDIFSNKQVMHQRNFQLQQSTEYVANTQETVNHDIAKAKRRINQAIALIAVAQKAVNYRQDELKIQQDKQDAGLNIEADLLNTKSMLAKAQADLLSAQLNYRIAISDLRILTGAY